MKAGIWCVIILSFNVLATVTDEPKIQAQSLPAICADISPGDLVFRRGTGFFSRYFMEAGNKAASFSHVGLLVKQGGRLNVVHAEASELTGIGEVRSEPLELFLSDANAKAGAVYRVTATKNQRYNAIENAIDAFKRKVPFDSAFNAADASKLYCTELVWWAYKQAGVDLAPVRDHLRFGSEKREIISLNNILDSSSVYELGRLKP